MNARLFTITALLLAGASASTQALAEPYVYYGKRQHKPYLTKPQTSVNIDAGVRHNNFDWNISSEPTGTATPNILSELTWENIITLETTGTLRHEEPTRALGIHGALVVEGTLKAGITVDGDNQDSDFNGDNRTLEFSRSNNSSDEGYTLGASAAIGHKFYLTRPAPPSRSRRRRRASRKRARSAPNLSITPLIGYSWDQQTYKIQDGFQTIPANGPFPGLDSEYQATWSGPFAALEAEYGHKKHRVRLRGEYHDLNYDGEGISNLRTDFQQSPSFEQSGDGDGILINAQYGYAINSHYELSLTGMYQQRTVRNGQDTLFFSNGTIGETRLNEVNDESHAIRAGMRYNW